MGKYVNSMDASAYRTLATKYSKLQKENEELIHLLRGIDMPDKERDTGDLFKLVEKSSPWQTDISKLNDYEWCWVWDGTCSFIAQRLNGLWYCDDDIIDDIIAFIHIKKPYDYKVLSNG